MYFLRLREERQRLLKGQEEFAEACEVAKRTYMRWEKSTPIPCDKLSVLAKLGVDSQFVLTGVRSKNLTEITQKEEHPIFDFEGKLSVIIQVLDDELDARNLTLPAKAKGKVVEGLLMQALMSEQVPTRENIVPFLKVVGL